MDYSLRELEGSNRDIIYNWRNKESIRKNMYNDQPIYYETHCKWFEDVLTNQREYYRIFVYKEKPIGLVSFKNSAQQNDSCVWGFYIGEINSPKGSGTVMGRLALDYAFHLLGRKMVVGEVLSFNKISQLFHEKLGFMNKGNIEKKIIRNNEVIDVIRYEISEAQWKEKKKSLFLEDGMK